MIRQRAPDRQVYDTAWTLNVIRGRSVAAIVLLSAVPVARFFGDRRLVTVLAVIALPPVLDGLSNIGTVDFRREMQFRNEFAIMVVPKLFGIIATLTAAFIHPAYTALLYGITTNQTLRSAMSYVMHPFRPRFSLRAWRDLVGYSLWTWLLSLAILLRSRSDALLLGRLTNPAAVGVYAVGAEVASLPSSELVEPLCRASFAGFAAANREGTVVAETFIRLLSSAVVIIVPACLELALVAAALVSLAFGPGWDAAVPVLRILGLAGVVTVFGQTSLHLMSAQGHLAGLTAMTLAGAMLRIVLLLLLIPSFGISGAAWVVATSICIDQGAMLIMALRHLQVAPGAFVMSIARTLLAAGVMAWVVAEIGFRWPGDALVWLLAVQIAAGGISYTVALLVGWLVAGRPEGPEAIAVRMLRINRRND